MKPTKLIPLLLTQGALADFQVQSIESQNLDPVDLAEEIAGSGVSISNISFNQPGENDDSSPAAGTFSGGSSLVGFGSGVILSSGLVENLVGQNTSPSITGTLNTGSEPDLENIVDPGDIDQIENTYDSTVLEFTFVPDSNAITMQFVFASEEFNEWVGSEFNDVFGCFVNGVNYATVGVNDDPVTINTVNPASNSQFYVHNDVHSTPPPQNALTIQADGLTTVLTLHAPANPGVSNTFKLAIADAGDSAYDSWIMIKSGSLSTTEPFISSIHAADSLSQPGSTNTYTVGFKNLEAASETLYTASVRIPDGFQFIPGSTAGAINSNPSISGNTLTWTVNQSVASEASVGWTFGVRVPSEAGVYLASVDGTASIPVLQTTETASVSVGIAQPVGYVRLGDPNPAQASIPGLTDMAISLPFENPAEFVGTVSSASGSTIVLEDSPGFIADRWTGGVPYVVQVESGTSSGLNGIVSGNTSNSLDLVLHPAESLAGLSQGDVITIRKALTPANAFPISGGIGDGDLLLLFSGTYPGINISSDILVEYYQGDWYDMMDFSFADQYVIHRSESFIYRNSGSGAISDFLARGVVTSAAQRQHLEKLGTGVGQDIRVSFTSALPVDLNDSDLAINYGDELFTFNVGSGFNKSADQIFYHVGGGSWDDFMEGTLLLRPGAGYVLRLPSSAPTGYTLWTKAQSYATTLPPVAIDPNNVAHPQIFPLPPVSSPGEFRYRFFAEDDVTYVIQTSTDLSSWTTVETVVGEDSDVVRTDTAVSAERKFYRAQRQ